MEPKIAADLPGVTQRSRCSDRKVAGSVTRAPKHGMNRILLQMC